MWQTMIEDIDAISIGLRRRLPLPDAPWPSIVRPFGACAHEITSTTECPLLAQSGHGRMHYKYLLSGKADV
jgi:hypothetical protein